MDLAELRSLYEQSKAYAPDLHRSFEDLVSFHDTMMHERVEFMSRDLPDLQRRCSDDREAMDVLVRKTRELSDELSLLPTSEQIDELVNELGEMMRQKSVFEVRIAQIEES